MIRLEDINIVFDRPLFVHQNIEIKDHCLTLIAGESGCGKTTLLYQIGLINYSEKNAKYWINDIDITSFSMHKKTLFRRYNIAFVFQNYMLYEHFNVYENLCYYAALSNKSLNEEDAREYLNKVRLDVLLDKALYTLSGGQKQRLAIACALIKDAPILILDEPTSALDEKNAISIFQVLKEISQEKTVIVTSHNQIAYDYCDEIIEIKDGNIHKIKESHAKNQESVIHQKNSSHISWQTYRFYMKRQFHFSRKMKYLLILAHLVILLFCFGTVYLTDQSIQDNLNMISSKDPGWMYVEGIKKDELSSNIIMSSYPFYDVSLFILNDSYPVIPYYPEENIASKIWFRMDVTDNDGFYFSNSLYTSIKYLVAPTNEMSFLNISNGKEVSLFYKGILLQGVASELIDSKKFIYMPQELIENQLNPQQVNGYVVFCNSYQNYVQTKETLEKSAYKVITYHQFDSIAKYVERLHDIQQNLIIGILVLGCIILMIMYRSYIQSREKELSLLKCMGLTTLNISALVCFELILMNIIGLFIVFILTNLFIQDFYQYIFLVETAILLVNILLIVFMIKRIKPVKVFRN